MKICFLTDGPNTHTQKWVSFFANRGHKVHLITFRKAEIPGVVIHPVKITFPIAISPIASSVAKMGYFFYIKEIKKLVQKISPDILHAHWASSYGFLGAFSVYHPFVLSTWGSDVFDFPHRSFIHKKILTYTINKADYLTATSQMLAEETRKYLKKNKKIYTIPFGVDLELFKPEKRKPKKNVTIGVVKSLEKKYGIEYLIRAFALVSKKVSNSELLIIGKGSKEPRLKKLAHDLGIGNNAHFLGFVENKKIPKYLNQMDIFVVPSLLNESFGVAAVEAAACELPVIASNIGGLPEVVIDGETGFLVPPANPAAIAEKIMLLVKDTKLRKKMGEKARQFVAENYVWEENASQMERFYETIVLQTKNV